MKFCLLSGYSLNQHWDTSLTQYNLNWSYLSDTLVNGYLPDCTYFGIILFKIHTFYLFMNLNYNIDQKALLSSRSMAPTLNGLNVGRIFHQDLEVFPQTFLLESYIFCILLNNFSLVFSSPHITIPTCILPPPLPTTQLQDKEFHLNSFKLYNFSLCSFF